VKTSIYPGFLLEKTSIDLDVLWSSLLMALYTTPCLFTDVCPSKVGERTSILRTHGTYSVFTEKSWLVVISIDSAKHNLTWRVPYTDQKTLQKVHTISSILVYVFMWMNKLPLKFLQWGNGHMNIALKYYFFLTKLMYINYELPAVKHGQPFSFLLNWFRNIPVVAVLKRKTK